MAYIKKRSIRISENELLYCVHSIPDSVFNYVGRIVRNGPLNPYYSETIRVLLANPQMEEIWNKVNKIAIRLNKADPNKTINQTTELIFSILLESFRKRSSGLNIKSGFRGDKYRKSIMSAMEKLHALLGEYPHNWALISKNFFVAKLSSILGRANLEVSQFLPPKSFSKCGF